MENQLLFYKRAVPISNEAHRDLCVQGTGDYGFASAVNAVPLVAGEFRAAAVDLPIVFAGQGDDLMPMAVLGLRDGQNLFLDAQARWTGRYVPAFLRRYPFVFATTNDGQALTLCIDESHEGVNSDGRGERLFDAQGARSLYLGKVLEFLRDYQAQFERTRAFCKRLVAHDLLAPMHADYTLAGGAPGRLAGFSVINRDAIKALPDDVLRQMLATDELETAFVHLQSLENLRPLLDRAAATATGAAEG
jgi:hypothetical protein